MGRARAGFGTLFGADRGCGLSPRARRALSLAALALSACAEDGARGGELPIQTALTIDPLAEPDSFPGDVRCSNEPGAFRSYVATLTDEDAPGGPFTLASSPPVPCSSRVSFTYVVDGHNYKATIDGYDRDASQLTPLGGETSGSRRMLLGTSDEGTEGEEIAPRWRWTCPGDAELVAQESANVVVRGCSLETSDGAPQRTRIALYPARALGALRCEADGGTITSLDILPQDGALSPRTGVACPSEEDPARQLFGEDDPALTPGRTYFFRLEARDGDVALGSTCFATTREGVTVTATCDPLSATGALEIDVDALLPADGPACGDGASLYFVKALPGTAEFPPVGPVPCGERALLPALAPGAYEASVEVLGPEGDPVVSATCSGEVRPGATTRAACAPVAP